jgi:hypothetical protein
MGTMAARVAMRGIEATAPVFLGVQITREGILT